MSTLTAWLPRPTCDGFWWLRDGDGAPEIAQVRLHPWEEPHFSYSTHGGIGDTCSREVEGRALLWQRVAPPVGMEGT